MKLINRLFFVIFMFGMSSASFGYFLGFMNKTGEMVDVKVDMSACKNSHSAFLDDQNQAHFILGSGLEAKEGYPDGLAFGFSGELCLGKVILEWAKPGVSPKYFGGMGKTVKMEFSGVKEFVGKDNTVQFEITTDVDKQGEKYPFLEPAYLKS